MVIDPKKKLKVRGEVLKQISGPNGPEFDIKVSLEGKDLVIRGHLSGRMKTNYIQPQLNDEVDVLISPYDIHRGIIVYRY